MKVGVLESVVEEAALGWLAVLGYTVMTADCHATLTDGNIPAKTLLEMVVVGWTTHETH